MRRSSSSSGSGSGSSPANKKISSKEKLKRLASITSTAGFRSQATEEDLENSLHAVSKLALSTATIKMEELIMVRRLGEGAFAEIDLCRLPSQHPAILSRLRGSSYDGSAEAPKADEPEATMFVAVKKMKRMVPGPTDMNTGEMKMTPAPASWRVNFEAEAALLESLRHPNVVACYGHVITRNTQEGDLMFVQEFCGGGTLLEKLRRGRYPAANGLRWQTSASALSHARQSLASS